MGLAMTDIDHATFDGRASIRLLGCGGLFAGEEARILLGQCLVVGRSRTCDLSVARTTVFQKLGRDEVERNASYRRISRKHVRICLVEADVIEIEDLSTNGTVVNGHRVDRIRLTGFSSPDSLVVVEFGEGERIELTPGGALDQSESRLATLAQDESHSGIGRNAVT